MKMKTRLFVRALEPMRGWLFTASVEELRRELIPSQVDAVLHHRNTVVKLAA